jgi:hypothetical protein
MYRLEETRIPWTGADAYRLPAVRDLLVNLCGPCSDAMLPSKIEVLFDVSPGDSAAQSFLECLAAQLSREVVIWQERLLELSSSGLIDRRFLSDTCAMLRGAQRWYVCASEAGGLMAPESQSEADGDPERTPAGVIPCSAVKHHGVAWWRGMDGVRSIGLVTSHAAGGRWNWDEDIGHESAHAAFGPVPLFTQTLEASGFMTPLATALDNAGGHCTSALIGRTAYLISEIIVAFVRGEQRPTVVGLPGLHSMQDLEAFISLAERLFPEAGFTEVRREVLKEGIPLKVWSGPTIRRLGAAALHSTRSLIPLLNTTRPPPLEHFLKAAA